MRTLAYLFIAIVLCGCAAPKRPQTRTARVFDLPPEPPQVAAVIVPNEYPVTGLQLPVASRFVHRQGGLWFTLANGQLLLWNAGGQWRTLLLTNYIAYSGDADCAISGNRLVVSDMDIPEQANVVCEYTLADWVDGFPTIAVPTSTSWYGNNETRWVRALTLSSGAIMVCSMEHVGGWPLWVSYSPPSGQWFSDRYEFTQEWSIIAFDFDMREVGGKVKVLMAADTTGRITLAEFVEENGRLKNTDFIYDFLGPNSGDLAPHGEYARPFIAPVISQDKLVFSYPINKDGVWEDCGGELWRLAKGNVVTMELLNPVGGYINPKSIRLDWQNLHLTYQQVTGNTYRPQASKDLVKWTDMQVLEASTNAGWVSLLCLNPFFVEGKIEPSGAIRVKPQDYKLTLQHVTPRHTERIYWPTLFYSGASLNYFFRPYSSAICNLETQQIFSADTSLVASVPADYEVRAVGDGWALIIRDDVNYFIKRLM